MSNTEIGTDGGAAIDGVRYHKLLSVLDRSLASVVDTFQLDDIRAIFPDLAREIPEKLADSHEQISSYLRNSANSDFQAILIQYDMANKLSELDGLVKDAMERKQLASEQPSPHITPEAINRSRSVAIKRAELARLKDKLSQLKDENARYLVELDARRSELAAEHRILEETMELVNQV
ncbi:hypothetical protein GGI04_003264 [Coemansia thaxteri]|uniref:Uncharacterized protein n=1 Tax=Coemansia thaxteri TaxID=2663907 RepID=A0A9W8BGP8_9FUNG|nr:hypothetical protein H4R26_004150 [Coemansia thaxteri]KAJ2002618.1 hypothetical protein GGI04_003264 [Coemansia thaxteri]KAJ2470413.1 hypothetical protein GGI02_002944 [Coemansia sp. RSA 2322]KAJ2480537.1 hypothetical protein EV174_003698 [Coemansia sp. RSA 2320]